MTRSRKTIWFVVFAMIAVMVAVMIHDRFVRGPVYRDAPLNVWLRLLDDPSSQTRDKARDAIRHIGPAGVPLIIEWLDWKDSWFRRMLALWVARGGGQHISFHPLDSKDRRRLALSACDALGSVAQPAIPRLLALATTSNPELDAPFLIARLGGPNAPPALAHAAAVTNRYVSAGARVSTKLFRDPSISLLPDASTESEDTDYYRRLEDYHSLVLEAVAAARPSK